MHSMFFVLSFFSISCISCGSGISAVLDPDSTFHFNANPNPYLNHVPYLKDMNLRNYGSLHQCRGSIRIRFDPHHFDDPDPHKAKIVRQTFISTVCDFFLTFYRIRIRGIDPRLRIHTKMSWIPNIAQNDRNIGSL